MFSLIVNSLRLRTETCILGKVVLVDATVTWRIGPAKEEVIRKVQDVRIHLQDIEEKKVLSAPTMNDSRGDHNTLKMTYLTLQF